MSKRPVFVLEKLYLKDLSLEVPQAPHTFSEREAPDLSVQLSHNTAVFSEDEYECIVSSTVTARVGEDHLFIVEAKQAGIFRIQNVPEQHLDGVLNVDCPTVIYPYLREVISSTVVRAGLPPVLLTPVNFHALNEQKRARQKGGDAEASDSE